MDPQYWILAAYVIGTITGWFLFAHHNREFMVGRTLAMLAREGIITVEKDADGELQVHAVTADHDEIVATIIKQLEELQEQIKEEEEEEES